MDRRLFLTGLFGFAGTAALATAMPRQAGAAGGDPLEDLRPPRPDENLPEWEVAENAVEEGEQYAWHRGYPHRGQYRRHHRRRRRRIRRWRRRCYWRHGYRRCRRVPYFIWGW